MRTKGRPETLSEVTDIGSWLGDYDQIYRGRRSVLEMLVRLGHVTRGELRVQNLRLLLDSLERLTRAIRAGEERRLARFLPVLDELLGQVRRAFYRM